VYDHNVIDPMTFIVLTLAVMRTTRLGVLDNITLPLRALILKKTGLNSKLSYLVHCVFCFGFWASFIIIPHLIWPTNKWLNTCYLILAVAELAPRLLNWEPRTTTGGE